MSEEQMRKIINDQVAASMTEFMANMNRGTGYAGTDGAEAGGAGTGDAKASGAEAGGVGPAVPEITRSCINLVEWRIASMGIDAANGTPWTEVRKWMTEEFFPRSVLQRLEQELYNLKLKGLILMDIQTDSINWPYCVLEWWSLSRKDVTCFNCNEKGHLKRDCPKLKKNRQSGNNREAVYKLGAMDAQQDPKVVT
nr:hypothetical protein [Tanacetum cinerariifolium]